MADGKISSSNVGLAHKGIYFIPVKRVLFVISFYVICLRLFLKKYTMRFFKKKNLQMMEKLRDFYSVLRDSKLSKLLV